MRLAQTDVLKDIGHALDQEQKKNGVDRTLASQKVCGTALQI